MIFAVLENSFVTNIVEAESQDSVEGTTVDITELHPHPSIGFVYADGAFSDPTIPPPREVEIPVIPPPILLSEASGSMQVYLEEGNLFVGCITFDPIWARDALTEFIDNGAPSVGPVVASRHGIRYGEFFVTWDDLEIIRAFLTASGI